MKIRPSLLVAALLLGAPLAQAQTDPHAGHHPAAPVVAAAPADPAQAAIDVVEQFSAALKAGDLDRVGALLADDVLVLESGGAERSKQEYLGHHAGADAEFLKDTHVQVTGRTARLAGDVAWVGTESELHASNNGVPLTLLSSETMILARTAAGWRIVHIHWSSRPKK
jgi:uncharacterized protein (TIGR02246 family)